MANEPMAVRMGDLPAKTVVTGIRLTVVELHRSPHLFQAATASKASRCTAPHPTLPGPGSKNRGCRRRWYSSLGATHSWFFISSLHQVIARRPVRNDVRLADDASGLHSQGMEDALRQKIAVELAGDAVNQNSQRQITQIAVSPVRARRKGQRNSRPQSSAVRLRCSPCGS